MPPHRSPHFSPGQQPLPQWELSDLLDINRFGEVWMARHPHLGAVTPVTLHFFLAPIASLLRQHADRLLLRASESRRSGLVPLRQVHLGVEPLCLEYEFITTDTLCELLSKESSDNPAQRLEQACLVLSRLASILAPLHRRSPPLVHGDLKPANILGCRPGEMAIAQFGTGDILARQALVEAMRGEDAVWKESEMRKGAYTPLYAAPEMPWREQADPRDDIHALGVIFYQLLLGDCQIGIEDFDRLQERHIPEEFITLIRRCVSAAGQRFADAGELGQHLARLSVACRESVQPISAPSSRQTPGTDWPVVTVCAAGQGQHRSIGEAIQAARRPTRILVQPGTYRESVIIDREVELLAAGPRDRVAIESVDGSCLHLRAERATVRGFTLRPRGASKGLRVFGVQIDEGEPLVEDCDITNDRSACVAIHSGANPTIRHCLLHHSADGSGILLFNQGKGTIEHCDIFANKYNGIDIREDADPIIRHCSIHHNQEGGGVLVAQNGKGTIEHCDIFANKFAGVEIKQGADPLVRHCLLRESKVSGGVHVYEKARGTIEHCDIFANKLYGVSIQEESNATVRHCRIHDSLDGGGVYVFKQGQAHIESCDIFANRIAGIEVTQGSSITVTSCVIHDSREGAGVFGNEQGKGSIFKCVIHSNKCAGVECQLGASLMVVDCKMHGSRESGGVYVYKQGQVQLVKCEIFDNKMTGVMCKQQSLVKASECEIHHSLEGDGVNAWEEGKCEIEDCHIHDNKLNGVEVETRAHVAVARCRITGHGYQALYAHEGGRGKVIACEMSGNRHGAWNISADSQIERRNNRG